MKERTMWKSLPGWISKGAIIIEELGAGERAFGAAFVVTAEEKTGALGVKVRGGADIAPFVTAVAGYVITPSRFAYSPPAFGAILGHPGHFPFRGFLLFFFIFLSPSVLLACFLGMGDVVLDTVAALALPAVKGRTRLLIPNHTTILTAHSDALDIPLRLLQCIPQQPPVIPLKNLSCRVPLDIVMSQDS